MDKMIRKVTLLFLVKEGSTLLAMKKRGFGQGRWNGVGGKLNPGETIVEATIRETQEEISVTPIVIKQVATIDFNFPQDGPKKNFNQQAHVFFCEEWEGVPSESEEMSPLWYLNKEIPYDEMWTDDVYWLPEVLSGRQIKASFYFDDNDQVIKHKLVDVAKFT